jgi:hypothetical protein
VPGGTPASTNAASSAAGDAGVSSGALTRNEQPVASAELADDLVDREVPRCECRDRSDGLLEHALFHREVARRHDAAVDPAPLVGEPLDDVGGRQHLGARLGERLALLHGQKARDRVGALAHQARRRAHHRRALVRRHPAPRLEPAVRGCQREVEVRPRRMRHAADALAGGRVQHVERLAVGGVAPLVVDEKTGVGIRLSRHFATSS